MDHEEEAGVVKEDEPDGLVVEDVTSGTTSQLRNGYTTVDGTTSRRRALLSRCCRTISGISAMIVLSVAIHWGYHLIYASSGSSSFGSGQSNQNHENAYGVSWLPLPSSDKPLTKIAFGSCSKQNMPQPYWDTIVSESPDLLVLMGDNVYGDCEEDHCDRLKGAYEQWAAHPSFRGASQLIPMIATLDDHDYGQGDAYIDNPYKHLAKQMFLDFYSINDERVEREGVYQDFMFGPEGQRVQILLLDTRFSRSPFIDTGNSSAPYIPDTTNTTSKQMLSKEQWDWLAQALQVPAQVRLVVSSIQAFSSTDFECWRHIPQEQARLQTLLEDAASESLVVVLSGDRHKGGFYEFGDRIKEVTASSFTHTISFGAFSDCSNADECDEPDSYRVGDFVRYNHFGMISIDWEKMKATAALLRAESTPFFSYKVSHTWNHMTDAGEVLDYQIYNITQ